MEDDKSYNPLQERNNKCTNICFLVLFVLYWAGMVLVGFVGLATGDARRLIFATDYLGNTCGRCANESDSCGVNIYYPDPGSDADSLGIDLTNGVIPDVHLYGICVDTCPSPGDFVCQYDLDVELGTMKNQILLECSKKMNASCERYMNGCWFVAQLQSNAMFRCLGQNFLNRTSSFTCAYPEKQLNDALMPASVCPDEISSDVYSTECDDSECFQRSGQQCIDNPRCLYKTKKTETFSIESSDANAQSIILGQLGDWSAEIARAFGDVGSTWYTILTIGIFGAVILGFIWNAILAKMVGTFVWLMIFLSLVCLVLSSLVCFVNAGMMTQEAMWLQDVTRNATLSVIAASSNQLGWEILAWILVILSVVFLVIVVAMLKQIRTAIAILEEASKAVSCMKTALFMPLYTCACTLILVVYATGIFGYLYTSGTVTPTNITFTGLTHQIQVANSRRLNVENVSNVVLQTVVGGTSTNVMILYHVFGCLWLFQVIDGINTMTIAGAACKWYWSRSKDQEISTFKEYKRTMFYHFGSVCFGAFFIALFKFIRIIVYYICEKTKKLQERNRVVWIILKVLQCCLWCFEKWLKYISTNAYILVIMNGQGFCDAARQSVSLFINNMGRMVTVSYLTSLVHGMSIIVIVATCTVLEWLWLQHDEAFQYGGSHQINSATLSIILTALASLWVASGFMQLYTTTVKTIMLSFCVDAEKNKDNKNYYMSGNIKKIFKRNKNKKARNKPNAVVPT